MEEVRNKGGIISAELRWEKSGYLSWRDTYIRRF